MIRRTLSPSCRIRFMLSLATLLSVVLSGCGGGVTAGLPHEDATFPANLPNYHAPEEWIALLEQAGLREYAALARELVRDDKVIVVTPAQLDGQVNSFAWITEREIWINAPMFSRYPDIGHQATIFLHELIHIQSGEASHEGAWWAIQDQFAVWWADRS